MIISLTLYSCVVDGCGADIIVAYVAYDQVCSSISWVVCISYNKAGYTATPVACGWAGTVIEVTRSLGQEQ